MPSIAVRCEGGRETGWTCSVVLSEGGSKVTTHRVAVRSPDLERLAPGADDPTGLVEASFEFLLERESPQSILRAFDLTEIGRYFPDYEREIRRRLAES